MAENLEIEVKFLEVDVPALHKKLAELGAEDLGNDLLREIIFYDKDLTWQREQKTRRRFVRLRQTRGQTFLTYKSRLTDGSEDYAEELETKVDDLDKMKQILEAVGLVAVRHQEKKRHSYKLGSVSIDIDTWPKIPTYVELEGPTEGDIKALTVKLGFDWSQGVFDTSIGMIENKYRLPVQDYKYFTFDKVE